MVEFSYPCAVQMETADLEISRLIVVFEYILPGLLKIMCLFFFGLRILNLTLSEKMLMFLLVVYCAGQDLNSVNVMVSVCLYEISRIIGRE